MIKDKLIRIKRSRLSKIELSLIDIFNELNENILNLFTKDLKY